MKERECESVRELVREMRTTSPVKWIGILGIKDMTNAQLFIPLRDGGFGLSSAEVQAQPALMASWIACEMRVTARIGLACVDEVSAEISDFLGTLCPDSRQSGEKQETTPTT